LIMRVRLIEVVVTLNLSIKISHLDRTVKMSVCRSQLDNATFLFACYRTAVIYNIIRIKATL
jgi:hypothetical protein